MMRRAFLLFFVLLPTVAIPNEVSYRSLQSGSDIGPTPLHDRGIRGEGQLIAILDTGLDYDNCYFAEPGNIPPPINTGFQVFGYQSENVDLNRRKVVAYDFLFSCDQYPNVSNCEDPQRADAWDNHGHGTHAAGAAAGDRAAYGTHDFGDAIAPMAKLIIQDAGAAVDNCSQFPALGCPITNLGAVLDVAYRQGARIHSNSWGDRQGTPPGAVPPTGNYSASARQVDEFLWNHPDFVMLFNTGNFLPTPPPPSSISAPGVAKNTIQVGGTRDGGFNSDETLAAFTGRGPSRDGRIKPDVVGPAWVLAADSDRNVTTNNCNANREGGTSWASPTLAGAVALIRQYYTDGFYPSGTRVSQNGRLPSAALLKATLIASTRRVPFYNALFTEPTPSYEQGFGFPVLDDALYFNGDHAKLRVFDLSREQGLFEGGTFEQTVTVATGTRLKVVLVWTDPPGTVASPTNTTPQLVNDLDLTVRDSANRVAFGNERLHPGQPDRLNNVEVVEYESPAGQYRISVRANRLGLGPTQNFALVVVGDFTDFTATGRRRPLRH